MAVQRRPLLLDIWSALEGPTYIALMELVTHCSKAAHPHRSFLSCQPHLLELGGLDFVPEIADDRIGITRDGPGRFLAVQAAEEPQVVNGAGLIGVAAAVNGKSVGVARADEEAGVFRPRRLFVPLHLLAVKRYPEPGAARNLDAAGDDRE